MRAKDNKDQTTEKLETIDFKKECRSSEEVHYTINIICFIVILRPTVDVFVLVVGLGY